MAVNPAPVIKPEDYAKLTPEQRKLADSIVATTTQSRLANPNDTLAKAQTTNTVPTTNTTTLQAPTFNANDYVNNGANGINSLVDKQKELQLSQFRASRDKAVGDINYQKEKLPGQYQPLRDNTDFQSKVAANKLREMMAAQGLGNSGTNVSGQMRINAANINALNALDTQQQDQVNEYDRSITDLMNPEKENAINLAMEIERLQQLNELRTRADDRTYDNDWRTYDANYRTGRDSVADNQWQTQFDYGKSQDSLANSWKARDWQHGLDREKIEDNRYADETAYKRKMDAIQLARSRSGGGGGGRRSSGGGRGGSSTGKYDEQQIGAEYINTVLGTRSNKANAQEQFNRDKASLAALGLSPKEIDYIQRRINGYKDDWVGPGYNSKNAPKNPLAGFWGTFNPNYKYVK